MLRYMHFIIIEIQIKKFCLYVSVRACVHVYLQACMHVRIYNVTFSIKKIFIKYAVERVQNYYRFVIVHYIILVLIIVMFSQNIIV